MDEDEYENEEPEEVEAPVSRNPKAAAASSRPRGARPARPAPRSRYPQEEEDDYDAYDERPSRPARSSAARPPPNRRPPPRGGRPPPRGRVVPYSRPQESSFAKGLNALRSSLPDPSTVREAALNSITAARKTTSNLSSNLYREVKGLTSSELEQVMLKATRPDDTPVKGKHVERLVGVTYQISSRYDIYDAVLRKLWSKMAEKDWRTTIKALYVLHRFSADGAPEHAAALKARLRELRRTRDPKRKDKFFNSKQLLAGDIKPENAKYHAFMARYAHYVLLRAQCFGGIFDEIASEPKPDKKKPAKPITATSLRVEHLDAAKMLLKAGIACQLRDGEDCENTAIAAERVASDLIGLSTSVAIALNRVLKTDNLKGGDPAIIKKWCQFYSEDLVKETRAMVKKTSGKLDAYGLFLPSRMGTSIPQDLLDKGLSLEAVAVSDEETVEPEAVSNNSAEEVEEEEQEQEAEAMEDEEEEGEEEDEIEEDAEDEYEYEEEEYYDDDEL